MIHILDELLNFLRTPHFESKIRRSPEKFGSASLPRAMKLGNELIHSLYNMIFKDASHNTLGSNSLPNLTALFNIQNLCLVALTENCIVYASLEKSVLTIKLALQIWCFIRPPPIIIIPVFFAYTEILFIFLISEINQ